MRMIQSALDLFHLQGVNATSIDQILERSGTGKSQFAHYFKTKEGLVHAVMVFLHEAIRDGQTPTGYDVRTWKDLKGWFRKYIAYQKSVNHERSCPMGTIGNDIRDDQELLRQDVRLFLQWSRSQLARFFAEKRAMSELDSSVDPDSLADFCISIMQGGMLLTKMKRDTDMFENASTHALAYIELLRVKKK